MQSDDTLPVDDDIDIRVQQKAKGWQRWPHVFLIKEQSIPKSVLQKLNGSVPLGETERSYLLEVVFAICSKFI